ncbi:calcium/sodium antiporter [Lactococcus kimchii]|uniref:calcium/sodium antiporter n=1 Tax=Lactococcus sp. S-13 TaxID=2507158 RepID=UPI0010232BCD|nr:calcium/sodium antiporter [Lactococcus sp. S-13]RZI48845.1 calcium/sodium antiporter [Lactococcus sp. S-13]
MEIILLIIGLVLVIKSADILIDSSSKIARNYGVSSFVIGITVVAFGTSAPELVVGILSALSGTNELGLGTVVGSSYANMTLIVGLSALVFPLVVNDSAIKKEIPMLIFVQALFAAMILWDNQLSRLDGLLLLGGFVAFMVYVVLDSKKSMKISIDIEGDIDTDGDGNQVTEYTTTEKIRSVPMLWLLSVLSLVGLYIGGQLSVENSVQIAKNFGLSETIIGLTIVAVATSLPELVTSIVAMRKNEKDIVLGNCVGSNIFNILLVMGVSSTIHPFSIQENMTVDLLLIIVIVGVIYLLSRFTKKVSRLFGSVLVLSYFSYLLLKVFVTLA